MIEQRVRFVCTPVCEYRSRWAAKESATLHISDNRGEQTMDYCFSIVLHFNNVLAVVEDWLCVYTDFLLSPFSWCAHPTQIIYAAIWADVVCIFLVVGFFVAVLLFLPCLYRAIVRWTLQNTRTLVIAFAAHVESSSYVLDWPKSNIVFLRLISSCRPH